MLAETFELKEPVLAGHSFTVNIDTGLTAVQEYSADGLKVPLTVLRAGRSGVPEGPCGTVDAFVRRLSHGCTTWAERRPMASSSATSRISSPARSATS
jgi:hypothetical protein